MTPHTAFIIVGSCAALAAIAVIYVGVWRWRIDREHRKWKQT